MHTSHNVFEYGKLFKHAKCDLYTGVSKSVVKNLTGFFHFEKQKVHLVYNGIDQYRGETFPVEHHSAVVAARLTEQKGHIYLIEAWKKVIEFIPDARLYIVGDGELRSELENVVFDKNLSSQIFFVGFKPNPMEWILKTEFCILPSLWEGLPLFPLEAFSVQRTIVATNVDGTPEIVIHNKTGFLVTPKNPDQLAESIVTMFKDKTIRTTMAQNGHEMFKKKFIQKTMLNTYEELYDQLLNS